MKIDIKGNVWFVIISVILVLAVFYFFTDIAIYILTSFILSLVGQPVMRFFLKKLRFERIKIGQPLSAILTLIIFLLVLALVLYFFIPTIAHQASHLGDLDYKQIATVVKQPLESIQPWAERVGVVFTEDKIQEYVNVFFKESFDSSRISNVFSSLIQVATDILIGIFSVLFITFFFLQNQGMFQSFIYTLVPNKYVPQVSNALEETIALLSRYFSGIFLQVVINTTYVSLLLTILGVKNGLLIGFFAAILNIIPYLGPALGAALGVLITITSNAEMDFYTVIMPMSLKVIIVMAIMQLIDNFILQPFIFSTSVKAHPLEIFIIILVAGKIGGIWGMVLAVPVYTMLRVVAKNFLSEFKVVQRLTRDINT